MNKPNFLYRGRVVETSERVLGAAVLVGALAATAAMAGVAAVFAYGESVFRPDRTSPLKPAEQGSVPPLAE